MPARFKIHEFNKIEGRTVFFDANVFLDIFWPTARSNNAELYSRFFKNCLIKKITVVVDFIVLSEVVNRAIRIEYAKYLRQMKMTSDDIPFKTYRDNVDGLRAQEDFYSIMTKALLKFAIDGKVYKKDDVLSFLNLDSLDFSDKGILSLCASKGYLLVTNDIDFSKQNIDIISANEKLVG